MSKRDKLRWCYTKYNQSLDVPMDLDFYYHLLDNDPDAAKFYMEFHNESSTNDPKTDWGRERRRMRRRDIYQYNSQVQLNRILEE